MQPPITAGEAFKDATLGASHSKVDIREVTVTPYATIFLAESSRSKFQKEREADIRVIRERIKQLANSPQGIVDMALETPFSPAMRPAGPGDLSEEVID